jgi:YidC/Oxa1 family membrane protein insertase
MLIAIIPVVKQLMDACKAVLDFWHGVLGDFEGSWGWSIVLLTFTVRLAILPLTFKGIKSMQRMQVLQPEIKKIQERYKGDRQRMNQEIMAFYQKEKVNPLGSCLPLALQIPFFIALFQLLRSAGFKADLGTNVSFLFIPDLTKKVTGHPAVLVTLIILYVGTQLASSLMMSSATMDPTQRKIMLVMPLFFVIFIINFPAGVIVYWITTNTWTMGQQYVIRRRIGPTRAPPAATAAAGATSVVPTSGRGSPQRDGKQAPASAPAADGNGSSGGGLGGLLRGRNKAAEEQKAAVATRSGPPPRPPRKKKKRSGRRR